MDAFFQCYNDMGGVESCINHFFKNGGNKVYLISDCGLDYTDFANKFKDRIIYKYSPININVRKWKTKYECKEWFDRVKDACELLIDDNIIILEEDVLIQKDLNSMKIDYALCGPRKHQYNDINCQINEFINKFGKKRGNYTFFGGCGGSVFSRKLYLEYYNWFIPILMDNFEYLVSIDGRFRYQDCCFTLMFDLIGYEYGPNECYGEPLYGEEYIKNKQNYKIIHHFDEDAII